MSDRLYVNIQDVGVSDAHWVRRMSASSIVCMLLLLETHPTAIGRSELFAQMDLPNMSHYRAGMEACIPSFVVAIPKRWRIIPLLFQNTHGTLGSDCR